MPLTSMITEATEFLVGTRAGRDAGAANFRSDADQSYISGAPLVGQLGGSSLAAWQSREQRLATNELLGARMSGVADTKIGDQSSFTRSNNQTAEKYAQESAKVNREAGDRMGAISIQQGKESAGAAYAGAGTAIAGHKAAQGLNDQATKVEFTGRVAAATITHTAAVDSAKLQAISTIISRMGAKLAQDIEKGMEMRY